MKNIISKIALFLLLCTLVLPAYAEFANPAIVDNAGYLTQSQVSELSQKLDAVREKYDFEVAIYTESDLTSPTAQESADDIYDYVGYGAGDNDDGIMLYICSGTREYHFTTHEKGIEYFNRNGLKYLENKVVPYLAQDNYYEAFQAYIDTADELLEMAYNGEPFNKKQYSIGYLLFIIAAAILLPLLVAYLRMNKKLKKMRTAVENDYATNYVKPGSFDINISRDLFLYSSVTKTEKPKSESSSGTHTSSSGRTHGGSGGSF